MRVWGAGIGLLLRADSSWVWGFGVFFLALALTDSLAVGDVRVGIMVVGVLDEAMGSFLPVATSALMDPFSIAVESLYAVMFRGWR